MDLGVFYEVIVPLMEVRGTATICISTPVGSWNFYSELTELLDDHGKLLFNVIKVGMVCDKCKGTEREHECTHPTGHRPEWKPDDTFEKVKAIYGTRKTLLKREILGQIADDENMAFRPADLKAFYSRATVDEPHSPVSAIYIAVDPNGGASGDGSGTGSETAVVSFYYNGANVVVSMIVVGLFFCFRRLFGFLPFVYHQLLCQKCISTGRLEGQGPLIAATSSCFLFEYWIIG